MTKDIYVPLNKHACIKFCRSFLKKEDDYLITFEDYYEVKNSLQNLIDSGMSPNDIKNKFNLTYTDFGMFLKKSFGVVLRDTKSAVINYYRNVGKLITEDKKLYYKQCKFNFDPFRYDFIPGFNLLKEFGVYHPINNPNGVCRDHMLSKAFGFTNQVDPKIISHPANCQYLLNIDNIKKNSSSSISLEDLIERIDKWDSQQLSELNFKIIVTEKSVEHRNKLSIANKKVWEKRKSGLLPWPKF